MRKRAVLLIIMVSALAAAIVITILLRRSAAPQAVRLLPAAQAYVYFDLAPLRRAGVLKQMPAVTLDPDYAQFVQETGFQFERDLDEAAFAVHLPSAAEGNAQAPQETRYSEVFVARFDAGKFTAYLGKLAAAVERYRDLDVYAVPLPGRTVRVAILNRNSVAVSNTEGPYAIQGMIDRFKDLTPVRGPDLVRNYYRQVPFGSLAWAIAQTASAPPTGNATFVLPGGYDLFFPPATVVVASLRYLGAVEFKAEAFAANDEQARRITDQLSAFLAIFRSIESAQAGAGNKDVDNFFDSIHVQQVDRRAQLTATVPPEFLKKLVAEAPSMPAAPPAAPAAEKKRAEPRRHGGRKR